MRALAIVLALASTARADLPADADRFVRAYDDAKGFQGAVLIAQGGKILFERGYGAEDAEHGVANVPKTKFRLGSITKTFTATAILMLAGDGKLKLDDSICKYVPECPKAWQPVTLHHLLSHTSGIPSFTDVPEYMKTMALPSAPLDTAKRMAKLPLEFTPGAKHHYSNTGYVLLGAVIEKAAGKSYEAFLRERIFSPLGMSDTGYDHGADILPRRARGYTMASGKLENASFIDMSVPGAAGGLYSTVEDLLKWDQALYGEKLLPAAARDQMFTPVLEQYGYGWVVSTLGPHKVIGHSGGINGFTSQLLRFTDDKCTVIVLGNREEVETSEVAKGLAEIALGMPYHAPRKHLAIKLDAKKLDLVVGDYELAPGFVLRVTRDGEQLSVQATNQPKFAIFPEAEREFFLKVIDAQLTFQGEPGQPATAVVLHQNGQDAPGKRIHRGEP